MCDTKRFLARDSLKFAVFAAWLIFAASQAHASIFVRDDSRIEDPAQRAKVAGAIDVVHKDPADRPAREILLQTLPDVVDTIGVSATYDFKDPLKTEVCKLIQGWMSVDVLADAMGGSDLMATWACRTIVLQSWNSDSRDLKAIGGVIDENAKTKLRPPVLHVLERKEATARAAAVHALANIFPADESVAVIKPLLKDAETKVATASVGELCRLGVYDKGIDASIWNLLAATDDPDLVVACCQWWWIVRQRHDTTITPDQEARFAKLATDSHPTVRREVALAVAEYATADHPLLVSLLLQLATGDTDEIARKNAVFSLRHAKTQLVYTSLTDFAKDPQSLVRDAAHRVLTEEKWDTGAFQR
jgi:hypothetical protein